MSNYYNPFMKGPDWGAGIAGTSNNILQMLLMKKLMGQGNDPANKINDSGGTMPVAPQPQGVDPATVNAEKMMFHGGQAADKWDDRGDIMSDPNIKDILSRFMALMKSGGMGGGM